MREGKREGPRRGEIKGGSECEGCNCIVHVVCITTNKNANKYHMKSCLNYV